MMWDFPENMLLALSGNNLDYVIVILATIMVIYIWEIVKFVQKIEIPIWTESLKFGSAIRPARKFEMLRIAWVRGLPETTGLNYFSRRPKILSPKSKS